MTGGVFFRGSPGCAFGRPAGIFASDRPTVLPPYRPAPATIAPIRFTPSATAFSSGPNENRT